VDLDRILDAPRALALYRVGKLVTASLDLDATLNAITDAAHELTGADQTALFVCDLLGQLELRVGRGPVAAHAGVVVPSDSGIVGRALREQRVVRIEDMQNEPGRARPDLDSELNVRAYLVAPLIWRDEVLGVVTTACSTPGALSEAAAALVGELAEQAAAAVAHARAFIEEQYLREESQEINRQLAEQAAQLERVQLQLVQNEKMTAVGQLVQGLAHEMNTPLSVVISNMSVLARYGASLSDVARAAEKVAAAESALDVAAACQELRSVLAEADLEYVLEDLPALVDDSTASAKRVASIVRSLASFARHDKSTPGSLAIDEAIESALTLASNSLKKQAQVQRQFASVPPVVGLGHELIELFLHLLINAAQALEPGTGTVRVETAHEDSSVIVRITDSGRGIPAEHLARVFDPFFTTREPGHGTGMGLAVCHGIASRHGGDIRIDSTVGAGTTVTVRLPAAPTATRLAA